MDLRLHTGIAVRANYAASVHHRPPAGTLSAMSAGDLEARVSALETRVRELAEQLHVRLDTAAHPGSTEVTGAAPGQAEG